MEAKTGGREGIRIGARKRELEAMHGLQVMYIKKEGVPRQGRDIHTRWWLFLLDVALETFYLLLMPDTKKYVSSSLFYIHTYIHYLKQIHTLNLYF